MATLGLGWGRLRCSTTLEEEAALGALEEVERPGREVMRGGAPGMSSLWSSRVGGLAEATSGWEGSGVVRGSWLESVLVFFDGRSESPKAGFVAARLRPGRTGCLGAGRFVGGSCSEAESSSHSAFSETPRALTISSWLKSTKSWGGRGMWHQYFSLSFSAGSFLSARRPR